MRCFWGGSVEDYGTHTGSLSLTPNARPEVTAPEMIALASRYTVPQVSVSVCLSNSLCLALALSLSLSLSNHQAPIRETDDADDDDDEESQRYRRQLAENKAESLRYMADATSIDLLYIIRTALAPQACQAWCCITTPSPL